MIKNKKLVSLFLAISMAASIVITPSFAAQNDKAQATRGQVVSMLLDAADAYNPSVKKENIMRGDENGNLNENAPIRRIEALVMIGRAFGTLPAPTGNNLRTSNPGATFSDLPSWAMAEMDNILASGIVTGTGDGKFSPDNNVTIEQMNLFIRRVWALFGSNKKDDYYAAVNKIWLDTTKLGVGASATSALSQIGEKNSENAAKIVTEMAEKDTFANEKERKIHDYYMSITDDAGRAQVGMTPLMPYITAINNAANLAELTKAREKCMSELGMPIMASFSLIPDFSDTNKAVMTATFGQPALSKEQYEVGGDVVEVYKRVLSRFLQLTGENPQQAGIHASEYYSFEKQLAKDSKSVLEQSNVGKNYKTYSIDEFAAMFPKIDIKKMIASDGYQVPDKIVIFDDGALKQPRAVMNDENLTLQKTMAKLTLVSAFGGTLTDEVLEINADLTEAILGYRPESKIADTALDITQYTMRNYVGELYVQKYFSAQAKADVTTMVKEFIEIYKQRIRNSDWLSVETQNQAIKKLNAMSLKIGYPDKWNDYIDGAVIKAPKDGGSYFENTRSIQLAAQQEMVKQQNKKIDKSEWGISVYTANAFYNALLNEITIPAGILQKPYYDKNASREENLGGIGFVIAHELTHAFDSLGSQFDENGNKRDWWTKEDYAKFEKKCANIVEFYNGFEVAPGIANNGELTLNENIADLGAAACIIDAAHKLPNPDFKKLFESMAASWTEANNKQYLEYMKNADLHSFSKLRINRVLVNFEEFYTTYNITEKDGMYIAKDKRVSIW